MSVASLLRPTQSLRWCKGTKLLQWIQIIHCSLSPLQNHCQVKVQVYDIESHQFQSLSSCWAPCHLFARKWRQMAKALMNGSSTLIQCIQKWLYQGCSLHAKSQWLLLIYRLTVCKCRCWMRWGARFVRIKDWIRCWYVGEGVILRKHEEKRTFSRWKTFYTDNFKLMKELKRKCKRNVLQKKVIEF